MGFERLSAMVLAGAVAACTTPRASYPSWEPTSAAVPMVRDPKLALADLEVSRKLWLGRSWQDYSYVRARQTSPDQVEFTLIVVRGGRVSERSLMVLPTDASGLGDRSSGKLGQTPQVRWREHGREIGRHETGAPALTMDQLYDLCRERVLSVQSEHSPRLSFHRDGLLQHCGFLGDDCEDCATVSVQTVAGVTPRPWQVPPDVLCADRYGLFLQGQAPLTESSCEVCWCTASNLADPRLVPVPIPDADEGGADICKIDPPSCPRVKQPDHANWFCKYLLTGDGCGGAPLRHVTPDCLALPRPTSWSDPAWQRRCGPGR
jgi:hypothetical protein